MWKCTFDIICSGILLVGCEISIDCVRYQSQNYQVQSRSIEDPFFSALKHYVGQNMMCHTSVFKVWCPTYCHSYMTLLSFSSRNILVSYRGSGLLNFTLIRLDSFVFPSCLNCFSKVIPFVLSAICYKHLCVCLW